MERIKLTSLLRNNGCITVNKYLIQAIGLNEATLYSELCSRHEYFEGKGLLKEKYFYNTQYDLQAGTGLGEKAQRTAISKLKALGLIDVVKKGLPAKRYFTIIDSDELLFKLLAEGKEKLLRLESPTDTSIGGNLKLRGKELDTDKGSANNTKLNNTKHNTKCLHYLNELDNEYINCYLKIMKAYGYEHKRVNADNFLYIKKSVETIKEFIDIGTWKEEIDNHFKNLPEGSDGDMLLFLKATYRHFNIEL